MSSILTAIRDYAGARESLNAAANTIIGDRDLERIKRLGMSPRQQRLNFLWSFYAACQYDGRKVAWDGGEYMDPAAREAVASHGVIPPGFYDAADSMPLRFRRPLAPYHLARVITSRFTGLLFSERRHPRVTCPGDPVKEDYAQGLIEASRLWQRMNIARNFGGATGSVGLGFQFVKGKPLIEVWDPRWCFPKFKSRATMELEALEIRWIYPVEERDDKGKWVEVPHWYRRYIDETQDIEWTAVPVGDGEEPNWEVAKHVTKTHGFKSFPGVWVQNSEVPDDIDGDGDYEAVIDMIEQMDRLLSRAIESVDLNCVGVETPFITEHGVRRFSDFKDGDAVTVLTHKGRMQKAIVRNHGQQQLYKARIGRGPNSQIVRVTKDHRWLLDNGSETTTLAPGMKLLKPPHLVRDWSFDEADECQRRYWTWGFVWGDGSAIKRRSTGEARASYARLCGPKGRFLSRFEGLGYHATYPPSGGGEPWVWLHDYCKTLPSLEEDGYDNVMAFVRGYLDADGSRNTRHPETSDINPFQGISATGQKSIDFIRNVFPAVGAYIVAEDDRSDVVTGYGGPTDVAYYFSLVLGFSNSPVAPYIVREITEDAVEDVWCLEVEKDRSFVLPCGIVTGNCDPTVVLSGLEDTADKIQEVKKGSHNALKLPKGNAAYMELNGSGPKSAMDAAEKLRDWVLEVAQCVIEDPSKGSAATATEIERNYASMHERADVLREQWGSRAILPLVEKMITAAQSLEGGRLDDKGIRSIGKVQVPPKLSPGPDGKQVVTLRAIPAPDGPPLQIVWPPYFQPTLDDANKAVTTAMQATGGQSALMDLDTAVKFIAPYVASIDNAQQLVDKLKQEAEAKKAEMDAQMMQGLGGFGGPPPQGPPGEGQPPPAAPDDGAPPEMPPEPPPAA